MQGVKVDIWTAPLGDSPSTHLATLHQQVVVPVKGDLIQVVVNNHLSNYTIVRRTFAVVQGHVNLKIEVMLERVYRPAGLRDA